MAHPALGGHPAGVFSRQGGVAQHLPRLVEAVHQNGQILVQRSAAMRIALDLLVLVYLHVVCVEGDVGAGVVGDAQKLVIRVEIEIGDHLLDLVF